MKNNILEKPLVQFLLLWFAVFLVFWPASHNHFIFDATKWLCAFDDYGPSGLVHTFGYHSLHHLEFAAFYGIYSLFGLWEPGWHLVFTLGHAFNIWLLARLLRQLVPAWPAGWVWTAALLFGFSPVMTETVVYGAVFHYIISLALLLGSLLAHLRFAQTGSRKWVALTLLLYVLGLFTLEIAYIYAPLHLLLALWLHLDSTRTLSPAYTWRSVVVSLLLPFVGLLGLYMFGNLLYSGDPVGHYGAERHLSLGPLHLAQGYGTQLANMLPGVNRWPAFTNPIQDWVYGTALVQPGWLALIAALLTAASSALLYLGLKKRGRWLTIAALWGFYLVVQLPTANLILPVASRIGYADNYSYFGASMLYPAVAVLLWHIWHTLPRLAIVLAVAVAVCQLYLLSVTVRNWQGAGVLGQRLIDTYPWHVRGNIFVVNAPENYHGVYVAAAGGFQRALHLHHPHYDTSMVKLIVNHYPQSITDSCTIRQDSTGHFTIGYMRDGDWFSWGSRIGVTDRRTKWYATEIDELYGSCYYRILPTPEARQLPCFILYQAGGHWKTISIPKP